ncbi:hypothetical protein N7481_011241 [Penicillium waksmanii]|uniref:uncharacterized protein n=1 Tax=Penicillium waksmanii TaxID=69791 RepID=UPI0025487859|nr:uncharacterized protein N7481_011241 [Penicillium waksmanii]KAJ5974031.1 hypothetical protein N7481_011241 [Penicillium waksmanii]
MRCGSAWLLSLAGAAALSNALYLAKRDNPAVLALPFVRDQDSSRKISKRSKTVGVASGNNHDDYYLESYDYAVNLTFGTPPQHFKVYLETYGNGCWLDGVNDEFCGSYHNSSYCGGNGGYNQSASRTAKELHEKFVYDSLGEIDRGDYVTDTLMIGGATVNDMKMGITTGLPSSINTMKLAYGNESSTSLTQALADAGAINSPAFSLWAGNVLFGGVDKSKYNGTLQTLPIIDNSNFSKAFRVDMDGMFINGSSLASDTFPIDAVFDNSFSGTYVPKSVADAILPHLGNVSVPNSWGAVNFSCSSVSDDSTIGFKFGDLDFEFSLKKFISYEPGMGIPYDDPLTRLADFGDTCWLSIAENKPEHKAISQHGSIILGTDFMGLIYAVFDLENDEVSLAKRNWDSSSTDIVEITSGKDGVPGAKKSAATNTHIGADLGMTALIAASMLIMIFWCA